MQNYAMNWKVTYPRKWDKVTRTYQPGPVAQSFGTEDSDELFSLIEEAWKNGTELEIEITQWEPSDDDIRSHGEGMTMNEMHSAAWDQHVALHS